MALSAKTVKICKATAPVLKEHGLSITRNFYGNMFKAHPELQNVFNMSHHSVKPLQATALANALFAYASHMDNLGALGPAVQKIAHKHASLDILPEQYPIVGENLLKAIKETLGDACTPEIAEAWTEAYGALADILIGVEDEIKKSNLNKEGGYAGYRQMVVDQIEDHGGAVKSFYLKPQDGGKLPTFIPGQYISVKMSIPGREFLCTRNYSLSAAPTKDFYRLSITKAPHGTVSGFFHTEIKVGDVVPVGPPCGDFVLDKEGTGPLLFIAGARMAPTLSMLEDLLIESGTTRPVLLLRYCYFENEDPYKEYMERLSKKIPNFKTEAFYDQGEGVPQCAFNASQLNAAVKDFCRPSDVTVYLTGADRFMKNVFSTLKDWGCPEGNVKYEYFGPTQDISEHPE